MSDNLALDRLRDQIDALDEQLVQLLGQRASLALEVAAVKQGAPVYRPAREAQVIKHVIEVSKANHSTLPAAALTAIYREVISACRALQQPLTVACLGPEGTYSEEAARTHFGQTDTFMPCASLDEVIQVAEKGIAQVAVLPIENSTEGSITRTLDLLMYTTLQIVGEISLPIHHQLLTHATELKEITQVSGHPQALAQCREWLDKNLPDAERTPASSNAEAAMGVRGAAHKSHAAIASKRAADIYQVPILRHNIEDSSLNTTRFLIIGPQTSLPTGSDKTSVVCAVPNQPGTLHKLLSIFSDAGINLTKLESRPAPGALWDYVFFIDIDGHEKDEAILHAFDALHQHAIFVKVLGSYPKAV